MLSDANGPLGRHPARRPTAVPDLTDSFNTFAEGLKTAAEAKQAR